MAVTTRHKLLTGSWTADVETVEAGIRRFSPARSSENNCDVVLFEIGGDERLHVNVTHRYAPTPVSGWAGPGSVADGVVHIRLFADTKPPEMIRYIRDMVFAART